MGNTSKSVTLRTMITTELMIPAMATSNIQSIPRANESRMSERRQKNVIENKEDRIFVEKRDEV